MVTPELFARCDNCGWSGPVSRLLVVNDAWVCPRCHQDESALIVDPGAEGNKDQDSP